MTKVEKRDTTVVDFKSSKIEIAIKSAMKNSTGRRCYGKAKEIANEIESEYSSKEIVTIYEIEKEVFEKLTKKGLTDVARAYESYRTVQEAKRNKNTSDEEIKGLLNYSNKKIMEENSNKNPVIASTQRDLIAGVVSKDIAYREILPTRLTQAHKDGAIHIHDLDYLIQPIHNCTIINLQDMLDNGTIINGKTIDTPKSFKVACTVATQIIAQVASTQYGLI